MLAYLLGVVTLEAVVGLSAAVLSELICDKLCGDPSAIDVPSPEETQKRLNEAKAADERDEEERDEKESRDLGRKMRDTQQKLKEQAERLRKQLEAEERERKGGDARGGPGPGSGTAPKSNGCSGRTDEIPSDSPSTPHFPVPPAESRVKGGGPSGAPRGWGQEEAGASIGAVR